MHLSLPLLFLSCLLFLSQPSIARPGSIAIQIKGDSLRDEELEQKARELASLHEMEFLGGIGQLKGYYLFKIPTDDPEVLADLISTPLSQENEEEAGEEELEPARRARSIAKRETRNRMKRLVEEPLVKWAEVQKPLGRSKRIPVEAEENPGLIDYRTFEDPIFQNQWHLIDSANRFDINVTGVWDQGIYGEGVVVSVVDDGLAFDHPDFQGNYFPEGSYDFNFNDPEPLPSLKDDVHGTRCAGEIAAAPNAACGVGVAFKSKIAGERILSGDVTDAMEADAINYQWNLNDIYSNSWGPWDNGATVEGPGPLCKKAFEEGVAKGRGGKGSIFVFASGNGGNRDNCNFDGYTNSIYTISIGAIDRDNRMPSYQELCAAQMAVTYSSNTKDYIFSTTINGGCTDRHGGTSAAAPIAAGIFALVLGIRPNLTWRDMQWLVVKSAKMINPSDSDWYTNNAGHHFNHKYGFGSLDAFQIVELAKTWKLVGNHSSLPMDPMFIEEENAIPSGDTPLISTITVAQSNLVPGHLFRIEHITVTVDIRHDRRGDLVVTLTSPTGGEAFLATERSRDTSRDGLIGWTFMTVKFWGETPLGNWTLKVYDRPNPDKTGVMTKWSITFHGELSSSTDEVPTDEVPTDEEPTKGEPTDEEPTKEEPTDEEPTKGEPTDEEPTKEEPTTTSEGEMKIQILGLATAVCIVGVIGAVWLWKRRKGNLENERKEGGEGLMQPDDDDDEEVPLV